MIKQEPYDPQYIKELLQKEEEAITSAIADGCLDPRKTKDIWKSFSFTHAGKKYRMFILEYGRLPFSCFKPQNVRSGVVDNSNLVRVGEQIRLEGGILNPIVTWYHSPLKEEVQHGHHRLYGHRDVMPVDVLIPRFLQGKKVYEVRVDPHSGEEVYHDADNPLYKRQIARIKPNPMHANREYRMEDVAHQFTQCFQLDNSLDGLRNPNEREVSRQAFDRWMDQNYPKNFTDAKPRGNIFNQFVDLATSGGKQVKPYRNQKEILHRMHNLGWDTSHLGKVDAVGKWFDAVEDRLVAKTETNGDRLKAQVVYPLIEKYHGGNLDSWVDQGVSKINLYLEIDSSVKTYKKDLKSLTNERDRWTKRVEEYNTLLEKCCVPFEIATVYFPDQLEDPQDKGLLVNLSPNQLATQRLSAKHSIQ